MSSNNGKDSFIGRNLKEWLENTGEFTVDELIWKMNNGKIMILHLMIL